MIRYDVERYDTMRYDTIRYDTIRYDPRRCDPMRSDPIRYDTIRCDTIRYNTNVNCSKYTYTALQANKHIYNVLPYYNYRVYYFVILIFGTA